MLGSADEKNQLIHRCSIPFIRHVLAEFRAGQISASVAAAELDLSRSRLYVPAYFAAKQIKTLETANPHIDELREHHNAKELHREIKMPPRQAWDLALKQNRSALRAVPNCPWWPYVWSLRTSVLVSPQGRVPVGTQTLPVTAKPGSRVVFCHHPSGHQSIIAHHPKSNTLPTLLFTDLPK